MALSERQQKVFHSGGSIRPAHPVEKVVARLVFAALRMRGGFSTGGSWPIVKLAKSQNRKTVVVEVNAFDYVREVESDGQRLYMIRFKENWGKSGRKASEWLTEEPGSVLLRFLGQEGLEEKWGLLDG